MEEEPLFRTKMGNEDMKEFLVVRLNDSASKLGKPQGSIARSFGRLRTGSGAPS
jgi:hypothetical protein